ncbi:hypothetical protein Pse7367_2362 [Thalassoporum mexicanum PCC 7367]|nr:hypothetical protein [Pseudanabaena sp. PCC 7367]AFY70623.1 hypothetical protein Pse7367_2362 [Pseudanabaena sp. PCC 7367]
MPKQRYFVSADVSADRPYQFLQRDRLDFHLAAIPAKQKSIMPARY